MYSLQTSTSTYNISLDPIDLKTICRRLGRDDVGTKPLWTVPRDNEDYRRFELIVRNIRDPNSLKHSSDAADYPTVICYLCNIKVPSNYVTEHNNSEKHKLCLKITDTALQRVKDQMLMDDTQPTTTEHVSGYFCESCSMIVTNEHHENTEIHKSSTLHDKLLKNLLTIYIDRDNINNIDLIICDRNNDLETNELVKHAHTSDNKNDLDNDDKSKKRVRIRTSRRRNKKKTIHEYINDGVIIEKNNDNINNDTHSIKNYVRSLTEMFSESSVKYEYTHDKYVQINVAGYRKLLPIDNFLGIDRGSNMCLMCTQQSIKGSIEDHINEFEHMRKVMAPVNDQDCIRQIDASTYYCILCACLITGCDQTPNLNCYYHIRDKRHVMNARGALIQSNNDVTSDITKITHLDERADTNDNNKDIMDVNNVENITFCKANEGYDDTICDISTNVNKPQPYTHVSNSVNENNVNSSVSQVISEASIKEEFNYQMRATSKPKQVYCKVCDVIVPNTIYNINGHTMAHNHKSKYSKLLISNKIKLIDNGYFCELCNISLMPKNELEHISDICHQSKLPADKQPIAENNKINTSKTFCRVCAVYVNSADFGIHCNELRHKEMEGAYYDTMSDISSHENMSEPHTDEFHLIHNDTDNSSVTQVSSDASVKENLNSRQDEGGETKDNNKVTVTANNKENTSKMFCRVCAVYVNSADFGKHCNELRHKEMEGAYYDTMSDISSHENMSEPYTDEVHLIHNDTDNSSVTQVSSNASVKENLNSRLDEGGETKDNNKVTVTANNKENTSKMFCRVCAVYVNSADFGKHCNELRHKEMEGAYYDTMSDISSHENMSEPYTDEVHLIHNDTDNSSVTQVSSNASVKENLNSRLDEGGETKDNNKVTVTAINKENTSKMFCRVCAVYVNSADFGKHCNELRHKEMEGAYYDTMSDISSHENMSEPYTDEVHLIHNDTDNSSVTQVSSNASVKENLNSRLDEGGETKDNNKVTVTANNKENTSKMFCRVCAVYVNSADFGKHCNELRHKEMEVAYYDTMSDISSHDNMSESYTDEFHSIHNDTDNSSVTQVSSNASVKENLNSRLDEGAETNGNYKVTVTENNKESTSKMFCRVCAVYVNSADFCKHCNGLTHLAMEASYYDHMSDISSPENMSKTYTDEFHSMHNVTGNSSFTQAISCATVQVEFNYQVRATSNPKEVHCKACDVIVPNTIYNIKDHTTGRNHTLKYKKILISNNIKLMDNGYFCYICNETLMPKNELDHIYGSHHQSNLSADIQNDAVNIVSNATKGNQNNKIEVPVKYLNKTYCGICAIHIDTHNYNCHVKGGKHKKMAAKTKTTNVLTFKQAAQWKPVKATEINVNSKVNIGTEQKSRLKTESQVPAKQNVAVAAFSKSEQNTNAAQKKILYQMKSTENSKHVFCRVCNVKINNVIQDIIMHVNGCNHQKKYTTLLTSNKVRKNGDHFKCNACKVTITRCNEIYHILGRNHQANIKSDSN